MKKRMKMLENDKPKDQEEKKEGDAGAPEKKEEPKAEEKKESEEHDDAAADMELIKKMLDERLGAGKHTDDDVKACHEAMKCAMESGESKESAMEMAGHSMKMARYMQAKAPKESDEEKKEESKESDESKESKESKEAEEKKESVKESNKKIDPKDAEILKLKGEVASFREAAKKSEIASHLEKVCRESGLPMSVTKNFKDLVGDLKSKEEVVAKFKIFQEGYKHSASGEALDFADTLHHPDAGVTAETADDVAPGFADCTND